MIPRADVFARRATSQLRQCLPSVMCILLFLVLGSCIDRNVAVQREHEGAAQGQTFPPGTVGRVTSNYTLTMEGARRWYAVVRELHHYSQRNPSFHARFDFPLDSQMEQHVAEMEEVHPIAIAMRKHSLSPEEFISLTVLIGAGWTALRMEEEDGLSPALANVGPELLTFFRQHRRELQALSDAVTAVQQ